MIDEVRALITEYERWLRDRTVLRQVNENWVEVTTPHLDRHNDYLQVFVRRRNGGYILTDGGYVIEDLGQSGCSLDTPKRQQLLGLALAGFGVKNDRGELVVEATPDNFGVRKHNLVQAMLAVSDLFYLAQPSVATLFYEDVVAWLDLSEVRYTPSVKFTGKSGFDHLFGFVIPKSRTHPERIVEAIGRPNRDTAEAVAFKWVDTREVRSPDSRAYALINDQEQRVPQGVVDALRNYEVSPVLWGEREAVRAEFAA
jgi:hypothetical protein